MRRLALVCLFATAAAAQFQIPIPGQPRPGNYPPGTYPPGTQRPVTQRPVPGGVPTGRTRTTTERVEIERPPETAFAILRRLERKQIIVETEDHRVLFLRIGDDIRLDESKFHPGDQVTIVYVSDPEGHYTATDIDWRKAATEEEAADAQHPVEEGQLRPEPPDLKDDATIAAARTAATEFLDSLPSFQVKRNTARFVQQTARGPWEPQDVVTSTLAYKDGREAYTDVRIGNKKVDKDMQEIDGLRSTGEFGEILADIFDPWSGAVFTVPTRADMRGRRAMKYKFEIPQSRSSWRIAAPSEQYFPAYGGALWIDLETNRVLRLEMQALAMPKKFPFDTVEMTLDYDYVRLDAGKQFLLPTEAEALNCIRGTSICMRNTTSFRNYVKFTAESGIIFEDLK